MSGMPKRVSMYIRELQHAHIYIHLGSYRI